MRNASEGRQETNMRQPISGIHHVTAIASNPQRNLDFYTRVLGLRLVKRTVNFDDPGTYHFYFADEIDCSFDEPRSEEHTSELQSHLNLVCRLLLEKKKKKN